ncbi:hypothetical protein FJY84_02600 [Candidatus Bathyarchaeota archaeon]|nr:hypothetical protein [Candidatus Bathyarchaeota archaeon]
MSSISSLTPTICSLMKIDPPLNSTAESLKIVQDYAANILGEKVVEKILIYAPDAIGLSLYNDFKDDFITVESIAPLKVLLKAELPTYTPVCFGSMFTGASPEVHGIKKYEKPVLKCDTLFDALSRANKKVAIVAVTNSSIDLIFKKRAIDYYSLEYDPQVNEMTQLLIEEKDYDFILVYNQEYDDIMHASTPRDPKALDAFRNHLSAFNKISNTFNQRLQKKNRAIVFAPDHGTHLDANTGKGAHGTDLKEDIEVNHFWGIYNKNNN